MRRTTVVSVLTAAAIATLAAPAIAALPAPKNPEIKVPQSLGGVEVGMTVKSADKAWGGDGADCHFVDNSSYCQYRQTGVAENGDAYIGSDLEGNVSLAVINSGLNKEGTGYVTKGPLKRFETKEGLGLGDKASKIKKLYPKAKKLDHNRGYYVEGKGKSLMSFLATRNRSGARPRIFNISISDGLGE